MKFLCMLVLAIASTFATSSHAQTFTVGVSNCGNANTGYTYCQNILLTLGTTTTTMWLATVYPPYNSEEFFVGPLLGSFQVTDVQPSAYETITWTSLGRQYSGSFPTELTGTLTGFDGTTTSGSFDIKLSYSIGKTTRYAYGPIAASAGGTVTIN